MKTDYSIEKTELKGDALKDDKVKYPVAKNRINLSDKEKKRLVSEMKYEFQTLKEEREEIKLKGIPIEEWYEMIDAVYLGDLDDTDCMFNLHKPTMKVKIRRTCNDMLEAIFESEPKISVSPRPNFARSVGIEICQQQELFLDYAVDEVIPFRDELENCAYNAVSKNLGILRWTHNIDKERKKRYDTYEGKNEAQKDNEGKILPLLDEQGQPVLDKNGQPQPTIINKELDRFMQEHKEEWEQAKEDEDQDTLDRLEKYADEIQEEKKVHVVEEYTDITYNDPMPYSVNPKDFYISNSVNNYEDMKRENMFERESYTFSELKDKEEDNEFFDVDKLLKEDDEDDEDEYRARHMHKKYNILRSVRKFKKDGESKAIKIIAYMEENDNILLGVFNYDYFSVICEYVPFYINEELKGFYKPDSMGIDLYDNNIAEDAITNFTLEGASIANTITPISNDEDGVLSQFYRKAYGHGIPIESEPGKVRFLNEFMKSPDIAGLMLLKQDISRNADDVSGQSSLSTGRSDPIDPDAPARKTIALLGQTNKNIKGYLRSFIKGFNNSCYIILNIYYQICKDGRKYKLKTDKMVTGGNIFPYEHISNEAMAAKTSIESKAMSYDFDKLNQKNELIAIYQLLRQEPLVASNPAAIYYFLRTLIKAWSPMMSNIVDKIMPDPNQFKGIVAQAIVQGVWQYLENKIAESQVIDPKTGQQIAGGPPQFNADELKQYIGMLLKDLTTTPSKEEMQAREGK